MRPWFLLLKHYLCQQKSHHVTFSLLKGWLPAIDAQRVFVANSQEVLSQMHRDGLFRAGAGADYVESAILGETNLSVQQLMHKSLYP